MPNQNLQCNISDLPLFRKPDHHQKIRQNLSKQQLTQLMTLMSKMMIEYQNIQKGNHNE